MPTPTYDLIASNVLSSSASSVTFSSIPATYRDLILVVQVTATTGEIVANLRFNSDTGSNYYTVHMLGDGTNAVSSTINGTNLFGVFATTSPSGTGRWQIMDYSATDKHKSTLFRRDRVEGDTFAQAGRWASTSAINAVQIITASNQFASGSTFYLYGIVS